MPSPQKRRKLSLSQVSGMTLATRLARSENTTTGDATWVLMKARVIFNIGVSEEIAENTHGTVAERPAVAANRRGNENRKERPGQHNPANLTALHRAYM